MNEKVTKGQLLSAIKGSAGNVTVILERLKKEYGITITRDAIVWRRSNNEEIAEAFKQEKERTKDFVENEFFKQVKNGNMTAIIFYLKTQCKDRGYSERREITGADGASLQMGEIKIYIPDNGRDVHPENNKMREK